MEALTGQRDMSAASLKAYFQPLEQWLDVFLAESGDCVGWGGTDSYGFDKLLDHYSYEFFFCILYQTTKRTDDCAKQ